MVTLEPQKLSGSRVSRDYRYSVRSWGENFLSCLLVNQYCCHKSIVLISYFSSEMQRYFHILKM